MQSTKLAFAMANGRLRRTYQCMSLAFMCFLSFFVYVLSSPGLYIAITTQWGGLWVVGGHQGGGGSSHRAPYEHWVGFVCMGAPPICTPIWGKMGELRTHTRHPIFEHSLHQEEARTAGFSCGEKDSARREPPGSGRKCLNSNPIQTYTEFRQKI